MADTRRPIKEVAGKYSQWAAIALAMLGLVGQYFDSRDRQMAAAAKSEATAAEFAHKATITQAQAVRSDQATQEAIKRVWATCKENYVQTNTRIGGIEARVWNLVLRPSSGPDVTVSGVGRSARIEEIPASALLPTRPEPRDAPASLKFDEPLTFPTQEMVWDSPAPVRKPEVAKRTEER
jgi:hypothetical protein